MARKLRIGVSVFFGLLAVALCVLWVRSYWYAELVLCSVHQRFVLVGSQPGAIGFSVIPEESVDPWIVYKQPASEWHAREEEQWREQSWGGFYINYAHSPIFVAPYWFWHLILVTLACVPWLIRSDRFSLRFLLIVTTLVAAVLGWWYGRGGDKRRWLAEWEMHQGSYIASAPRGEAAGWGRR